MLLILVILYLYRNYGSHAAPLPELATAAWELAENTFHARDDPSKGCQIRTTWNILSSCLATTFACTWVSVHPNVPFLGESKWSILKRRAFLMFFSLLAPEVMIMWAFKQWRGAILIRDAINTARPEGYPRKSHNYLEFL